MNIWDAIDPDEYGGFTPSENWGDHNKICGLLLMALFIIRRESGWPIIIHNAYKTQGHSKNSQHYKAKASDWHFKTDVPFKEQVETVLDILDKYQLSDSMGVGIYPFWNNPGFHTDSRGSKARWSYNKHGKMVSFEEGLR